MATYLGADFLQDSGPRGTIVLASRDTEEATEDATLSGTAIVRFISALGQRASIELLHERKLIEADVPRETLNQLQLQVGDRCTIRLRLPRIYARAEAEREVRAIEHPPKRRLRLRRKS